MRCKDAQKMMNAWIDEELFPDQKEGVEDHLLNCSRCSAEARDLRRLIGILDTQPPTLPSAGLREKTLSLFIKETAPRRAAHWWPGMDWKLQTAMAASSLIGLGIGYTLGAGWADTQLIGQYGISGFLFSAGDVLSLWV